MTIHTIIFYLLAVMILGSTCIAITRRNLVHAVVYLVISFFGTSMMFYLLGAPLLAALEVIIYAGAIMILFLFIIMMMRTEDSGGRTLPGRHWLPAIVFSVIYIILGFLIATGEKDMGNWLKTAVAEPARFGQHLFQRHWLAIEIISLLLLIVLVGALRLGRSPRMPSSSHSENGEIP